MIKQAASRLLGRRLIQQRRFVLEFLAWRRRDYAAPSPGGIKRQVIRRNALRGTFVETGTYLGETTEFACSFSQRVVSLEPDPTLYAAAAAKFKSVPKVTLLNAPSESVFPSVVENLKGDVTFWLDGHYSGQGTYDGDQPTPIALELEAVGEALPHLSQVAVLIDDARCFGENGYPPISHLVAWAEANGLMWHIEHDIFVARRQVAA